MKEPSTLAWKERQPPLTGTPVRAFLDRLVAIAYGLGYDAIVRGFPPYQALLDEVVTCVARATGNARPRDVKVLDIACGTGTVAARLAREGYRVVALDVVEHLTAVAQRRHGSSGDIAFHNLDLARQPVPEAGTYDVLVSMHTLYWHPDLQGVLAACRAALRPGGHGLFLTYVRPAHVARTFHVIRAEQGLAGAVRALRWLLPTAVFEAVRHYEPRYMSRDEFHRTLAQAGLEVLDLRETFLAGLSLLALTRNPRPTRS
jgi:2-polyprenyl-3-methyl-5-hydroxy-6-metoxy-1,4-benzoquinol methylase